MIRKSSVQDDGYGPLGERAFALWDELAAESGRELLRMTGEVRLVDTRRNPRFAAVAEAMRRRGFWEILDEATAGFLLAEGGVIAHLDLAARHGATIRHGEEVAGWATDGTGVGVMTAQGEYRADRLVITTGSWAPELLCDLNLPLRVIRTVNGYFTPTRPDHWMLERGAPDFLLDVPEGDFYGMPGVEGVGLKIGRVGCWMGRPPPRGPSTGISARRRSPCCATCSIDTCRVPAARSCGASPAWRRTRPTTTSSSTATRPTGSFSSVAASPGAASNSPRRQARSWPTWPRTGRRATRSPSCRRAASRGGWRPSEAATVLDGRPGSGARPRRCRIGTEEVRWERSGSIWIP
jgi:glycine/D-amino acid oxidase-like deaminating enzyme